MEGILAALLMMGSFSLMAMVWKDLRNRGVPSRGVLAMLGFAVPIWMSLGGFLAVSGSYAISFEYLAITILWVLIVLLTNFLDVYIMRYRGMAELSSYRLGIDILFGVLADLVLFQFAPGPFTALALVLFFCTGLLLSSNRSQLVTFQRVSLRQTLVILTVQALLSSLVIATYKMGLSYQSGVLYHVAIAQALLHGTWFVIGRKTFLKSYRQGKITKTHILLATLFLLGGVYGEAHAVASLPVAVVLAMSVVPLLMFTLFDLKKREMHISKTSLLAFLVLAAGVAVLYLARVG